jgi:hypothetical protein
MIQPFRPVMPRRPEPPAAAQEPAADEDPMAAVVRQIIADEKARQARIAAGWDPTGWMSPGMKAAAARHKRRLGKLYCPQW